MHEVQEIPFDVPCKTRVWISDAALEGLDAFQKKKENPRGYFMAKLKHYAKAGFGEFEGGDIVREEGGVYRIGQRRSLFRLIGFFENESRASFIAIDTLM